MPTRSLRLALFAGCAAALVGCAAPPAAAPSSEDEPVLLFQTGFEGSTAVASPRPDGKPLTGFEREPLVGKDTTLAARSDMARDLPGGAEFFAEYTGGEPSQRFARVVPDPTRPGNQVLQMWLGDGWAADAGQRKSRVQTSLYGIKPGLKEFFTQVRLYVHPDFKALERFPGRITWLTLGEYWNNEWWLPGEPHGFRITLGIGKPSAAPAELNFILNGENAGQKEIWDGHNTRTKVPLGKWFLLETYFKEGNAQTGRFYVAITPDGGPREVVFDIRNFTHNTRDPAPNGMTGFNPMKLYTHPSFVSFVKANSAGKALQLYWDDFKLWQNKLPD